MRQMHRFILGAGLTGSTVLTILFMPDTQFKALVASLISGALGSILSTIASNWVFTLFGIPSASPLASIGG